MVSGIPTSCAHTRAHYLESSPDEVTRRWQKSEENQTASVLCTYAPLTTRSCVSTRGGGHSHAWGNHENAQQKGHSWPCPERQPQVTSTSQGNGHW
jgi:hypothetical protein